MLNPYLTPPQVEGPKSRSWADGFVFGYQGPSYSAMTPEEIAAEDPDAFNEGTLAGQQAAIDGITFDNVCCDLNVEGPGVVDGISPGIETFGLLRNLKHAVAASVAEGIVLLVDLAISLPTYYDNPNTALAEKSPELERMLDEMGITAPMDIYIGGGVDLDAAHCELQLTPMFRYRDKAIDSARGIGRSRWLVVSFRTGESGNPKYEEGQGF